MPDNIQNRLERIAADVFPGQTQIHALGENYYTFAIADAQGTKSVLPRIWIDPDTSDHQIQDKLRLALQTALHPETLPDDSSVPDLRTEGRAH
jgi:hypothetical protein